MAEFSRTVHKTRTGERREHVWLDVVQVIGGRGGESGGPLSQEEVAVIVTTVTLGLSSAHDLHTQTPLLWYISHTQTDSTAHVCVILLTRPKHLHPQQQNRNSAHDHQHTTMYPPPNMGWGSHLTLAGYGTLDKHGDYEFINWTGDVM